MGGCAGCGQAQGNRIDNLRLASKLFHNIDKKKEGQLNYQNLSDYFTEYTESSVNLILREIDLNTDGIIRKSEWLAYWEYVRLAGYNDKAIYKSLKKIEQGIPHLGFPGAASYQTSEPRQTLITGIEARLKEDSSVLPFLVEPSSS